MIRAASILTIGLAVLLETPALALAQRAVPPPRTHTVVVGGHAMRAQSYGLDARRPGEPVVVFEAGATNSLEVWDGIAPQVAESAAVVTYDRAGLGASAWDGVRPTPQHVAERLTTLLGEIGAPPPYVLVGYSWGGTLVRYFAGLHPDAVAGIVYVDPGPVVTQTLAGELELLEQSGAGTAGRDSLRAAATRAMQQMPEAMRAEFEVFSELMRVDVPERSLLPVPAVPTAVIIAGRHFPFPVELPYDQAAHFEVDLRHRIRLLSEWVLPSPSGMLLVSRAVTHAIPLEDPDLVTWVVRRVLLLARGQEAGGSSDRSPADTVFVAAPTGDSATDRTNVQAAFDAVQPGGTVRFAPGMYMLGAGVRLTVPDVTVLGHPDGTVLRGCDSEVMTERAVFSCSGFLE